MKTKKEILSKITGLTIDSNMVIIQTEISYVLQAMEEYSQENQYNIDDVIAMFPTNDEIEKEANSYDNNMASIAESNWIPIGFKSDGQKKSARQHGHAGYPAWIRQYGLKRSAYMGCACRRG